MVRPIPRWHLLVVALICLVAGIGAAHANIAWPDNLDKPPRSDGPTPVEMSLYLDDIGRIDVATHTYEVTGQLVMEWRDERLRAMFKEGARAPLEFEGSAVAEVQKRLWHPAVEIMNERGERKTGLLSLNIYPDGRVKLYEKFDSVPHLEGEMQLFPFVQARLRLAFNAYLQDQAEMTLKVRRFEFDPGESADDVIGGPWDFLGMRTEQSTTLRSDEPEVLYSRVDFILDVQRDLLSGISIFILPVILIWVCSSALLWLDPVENSSYTGPRIGGLLTLLLTTVALQLTLEARLPGVHYLTLPNLLFYETILLDTVGVVLTVIHINLSHRHSKTQIHRFDRIARWSYPSIAVLVAVLGSFALTWQSTT